MPTHLTQAGQAALDKLLDVYPESGAPGTVVGLVNAKGEMIFSRGAGPKTVGSDVEIRADDVFAIYSCTKMVTGLAAMQLVERGVISLDTPVGDIVPELAEPEMFVETTETECKTRKATKKMTVQQILTHTAGGGYPWYSQDLYNWVQQNQAGFDGKQLLRVPLLFEPGEGFAYGVNLDWVGFVVERASGMSLGKYCEENIFKPLGLKDTTFFLYERPDLQARAIGKHKWDMAKETYTPDKWSSWKTGEKDEVTLVQSGGGGGGLYSTAPDYCQMLAVLMNGGMGPNGVRVLKEDTVQLMWQNHVGKLSLPGALDVNGAVATTDKKRAGTELRLMPGIRKGWGLSFLLNMEDLPSGRKAGSGEWGGIANLWWYCDPTTGVGAVIFNHVLPYGMPPFFKLVGDVEAVIYGEGNLETRA